MKKIFIILQFVIYMNVAISQQYIVSFHTHNTNDIPSFVSIDYIKGDSVVGYIWGENNYKTFMKIYPCARLINNHLKSKSILMAQSPSQMDNWDRYPTYDTYLQMMEMWHKNHPNICQIDTIGPSQQGRLLITAVISDNVYDKTEFKPRFFYTSTMHGDEVVGYVILMRLIDYLLNNYNKDSLITYLINNFRIYINPLANPDGTYHGGNDDISGAIRYYSNGTDPNRDFFPIPGQTEKTGAKETEEMKAYATREHFIMSMNIHGGAEVYNYPWDVYKTNEKVHPDNSWFQTIGQRFVETARKVDPSYMTDTYSSGITEGGDWYVVSGSRQDYMNYAQHCKEVTFEMSSTKMPGSDQLPYFWNVTHQALINYILEAQRGLAGLILDSTEQPISATIKLIGYDHDSSDVKTIIQNGTYFRPLLPGNYFLAFYSKDTVLWADSVQIYPGLNIINFLPKSKRHKILFLPINEHGDTLSGVKIKIFSNQDSSILILNGPTIDTLITGVYKIQVIDQQINYNQIFYKAITKTDTIIFTLPSQAIANIPKINTKDKVQIYPNPAHNWIIIKGKALSQIMLFDLTGKKILKHKINDTSTKLNLTTLEPGVYLVIIETQNNSLIYKKLILQ